MEKKKKQDIEATEKVLADGGELQERESNERVPACQKKRQKFSAR